MLFFKTEKRALSLLCRFQKGVIFSRSLSLGLDGLFFYARVWGTPHTLRERTHHQKPLLIERENNRDLFSPKKEFPFFFFSFFSSVSCLGFIGLRVFDTLNNTKSNIRVWKKLFLPFWTQEDFLSKSFETFFKGEEYALLVLVLTPRADK